MGLFIKREKFKEYMLDDQPDIKYDENAVLLSLNTVRGKAVTNCIHFSKEAGLYAAQYESMWDIFGNGFYIPAAKIKKVYRKEQLLLTYLYIETTQEVNGQLMKLKLNLPKLNRTPWHIKNLKRLQAQVPVAK